MRKILPETFHEAFINTAFDKAFDKAFLSALILADGAVGQPITGLPRVDARGQGGLLDAALSPDFVSDRTIFWSYAEPREGGNGTAVARGVLSPDRRRVEQVRVIFRVVPTYNGTAHFGSRLAFSPDGSVPDDNPFVGQVGARPEIWTLGHRNIQAAAFDTSGQLWTVEHGTQGGDELNLIPKGKNYGWPIIGALNLVTDEQAGELWRVAPRG